MAEGVEAITVLTIRETEYLPHVYTMSGGEFSTMVEAVRQLPKREFKNTFGFKHWQITEAGVRHLREHGYTLVREEDLFVKDLEHSMGYKDTVRGGYSISITIDLRSHTGEPPASNVSGLMTSLLLYVREDFLTIRKKSLTASWQTLGDTYAVQDEQAVKSARLETIDLYRKRIQASFQEKRGGGTLGEIRDALHALEEQIEQEREQGSATFAAVLIDENAVVVEATHLVAQAFIQDGKKQVEAQQQVEREAREWEQREKVEHAPQHVNAWFHRLTKSEIAEVMKSRAGREVATRKTKKDLIASIVVNRELCEQLIMVKR